MVLRKCSVCDRTFAKTEHFKRHQRSHTKERPYECVVCNKRFSRSDVLFRHNKLHTQEELDAHGGGPSDGMVKDPRMPSNDGLPPNHLQQEHQHQPLASMSSSMNPSPIQHDMYQQIHPSLRGQMSLPNIPDYNQGPQNLYNSAPPPPLMSSHSYSAIQGQPMQTYNQQSPGMHVDPALQDMSPLPRILGDMSAPQSRASPLDLRQFDGNANEMLQFWLDHADNDIDYSALNLPDVQDPLQPRILTPQVVSQPTPGASDTGSVSSIPDERFARVESCWKLASSENKNFTNTLWHDVANTSHPNIFSLAPTAPHMPPPGMSETRWGVDAEIRRQLKAEFTSTPTTPAGSRAPSVSRASGLTFPPPEVLDICLDMYFKRFHPKAPFIHVPSFNAASTPLPLLFIMCILGLSAMGTSGGSKFIKHAFMTIHHKAHQEMAFNATTSASTERKMCTFATSFLTLKFAAVSGDKDHIAQSQALYSNLIATAQRQGLFSVAETHIGAILPESMGQVQRWQAWARVESVKRLISCMMTVDWYYGNFSLACPIIRPESLKISLPSDDDLFRAESSERWFQLLQSGRNVELPAVQPRKFIQRGSLDNILYQRYPLQPFSTFTILSIIKLTMSDFHHRHVVPWRDDGERPDQPHLIPWHIYNQDLSARALGPVTVSLAQAATASPRYSDLNTTILWHNLCITLGANIFVFELAAGRRGAVAGSKALMDIAEWSRTPTARRACIHAAHVYKLLSNRRLSDTIMLNSTTALFVSALILGLYIFTAPPSSSVGSGQGEVRFELTDDVDWTIVGECGLSDHPASASMMYEAPQNTPATEFINLGGAISFGGTPFNVGYVSAKRVLLDYAHLMDEMGPWKPKMLSRILHIMSDVLEEGL